MHSVPLALQEILSKCNLLPVEEVDLELAQGRVLATDAVADTELPAFDRSAMDGIAVACANATQIGCILTEIGHSAAGAPFAGAWKPGGCVRIMTGGVVPPGADAVIAVEQVERMVDGAVVRYRLLVAARPEQNITRKGAEVFQGQVVVRQGQRLGAAHLGVLASFGHARVAVSARPKVAVLPTGSEVVPVHCKPGLGQIRDSNRHVITALLADAGADVRQYPVALDTAEALTAALAAAWAEADVVVTSGGVSAGDHDLVPPTLLALGAQCHLHRIAIKPGKPFLFATRTRADGRIQYAFGLPGNPISSYVCAVLLMLPALAAMQGQGNDGQREWQLLEIPCSIPLPAIGPRMEVLAANLGTQLGESTHVVPRFAKGSADLTEFARGDVWVLRAAGSPPIEAGQTVSVLIRSRA